MACSADTGAIALTAPGTSRSSVVPCMCNTLFKRNNVIFSCLLHASWIYLWAGQCGLLLIKSFSTHRSYTAVKKWLYSIAVFLEKKKPKQTSCIGIFPLDCLCSSEKFNCSCELRVATLCTCLSTCCSWVGEYVWLSGNFSHSARTDKPS